MKIDGKIKAKGARFVRFYPSDWRSGCLGLSLEQEGLYVRVCAFIYETNRRLPLDDCAAAKFMGAHTNAYRKIRDQLVELGKVSRCADGYTVARAERELAAAIGSSPAADQEGALNGSAHSAPERDTRSDSIGDTPLDTPLDTPPDTHGVFFKSANKFNGPLIEPKANSLKPKKETPKPPRGAQTADTPSNVKPVANWNRAFAPVDENQSGVIRTEAGCIQLSNGTHLRWLERFGSPARLDLALIEIAGEINTGSRKPLCADVEMRLARKVAEKIDRDERYQAAVASNAAAKAAPKPVKLSRWG